MVAKVNSLKLQIDHVAAIVGFQIKTNVEKVTMKVASFFISAAQAEQNLKELGNNDFETVKANARAAWNKVLGKVAV